MNNVRGWLAQCTAKAADNIADAEVLEAFLEIVLLMKSGEPEGARRVLAQLQVKIESHQVWYYGIGN